MTVQDGIKVSAIVSTYKSERFFRGCLDGLVRQTLFIKGQLEIIIIDSASPENEGAIAEEFQARFSNIRYLRTNNRETVYEAWNRGIGMALGLAVINANTDDRFADDALEYLFEALCGNPDIHAVYGDWLVTQYENDTFTSNTTKFLFCYPEFYPPLLFYYQISSHAALFRKEVFSQIGCYDPSLKVFGDRELMLRFSIAGLTAKHVSKTVGLYYENQHGVERSKSSGDQEFNNLMTKYLSPEMVIRLFNLDSSALESELLSKLYTMIGVLGKDFYLWNGTLASTLDFSSLDFAARCFSIALAHASANSVAYNNLAIIYACHGSFDTASDIFTKALQSDSSGAVNENLKHAQSHVIDLDCYTWLNCEGTSHSSIIEMVPPGHLSSSILVSAIVSVFNAERFICGCLEDLIRQSLFAKGQLEIIIVNSGSAQNEETVITRFLKKHPERIHYIRTEERETIYKAWNRGIEIAQGQFITNANTDDRHRWDALEIMARELSCHPDVAVVYADSIVTELENENFATAQVSAHFLWPEYHPVTLFQCAHIGPHPMWRRSSHERYGYFNDSLQSAGDYEFWLRLAAAGEIFLHIQEMLGLYLKSPNGAEESNYDISNFETERARITCWPASWGIRPQPEGYYLFPVKNNSSEPLVSIVVPTYNRPDFLVQALQSILEQTYRNFEILLVNDGGIDVRELIEYIDPENKVRYFNLTERVERSAARNHALRHACGKYIAYLDDDDWYYPEHLETLVKYLEKGNCRAAYVDAHRVIQEKHGEQYKNILQDVPYSRDFDPEQMLATNYIPILCMMHERSCLDETGLFDETLSCHEDWDLLIRMSQKFSFTHIGKVTCAYSYRLDGSSTSGGARPMFLSSYRQLLQRYRHLTASKPEIAQKQQAILMGYVEKVYEFIEARLKQSGLQYPAQFPSDENLNLICQSGASLQQIYSAYYRMSAHPLLKSDPATAQQLLRKSLEFDQENIFALQDLAKLFAHNGDWPAATEVLEALWQMNPGDEALQEMLEMACRQFDVSKAEHFKARFVTTSRTPGLTTCSIIIPLFNQVDYTRKCIEALKCNSNYQRIREIILVDNGSEDVTPVYTAELEGVLVIRNDLNLGFAVACNQGARIATGDYLLFLNNDTEPQMGWLEPLLLILDCDQSVGAVSSKLLYPDGTIQHAGVIIADDRMHQMPLHAGNNCVGRPSDYPKANSMMKFQALSAACLAVRNIAFNKAGGFDEGFWNGYEDVDLCFRLGQMGWSLVYQPASVVIHHESKSGKTRFAKVEQNMDRLCEKWLGKIKPDIFIDKDGREHKGPGLWEGLTGGYELPCRSSRK